MQKMENSCWIYLCGRKVGEIFPALAKCRNRKNNLFIESFFVILLLTKCAIAKQKKNEDFRLNARNHSFTFPLGAVVNLWMLAWLQVWMRQRVVHGWSTQQLLRTAATQAVLTAIRGPNSFRGALQNLTLPAGQYPSGASSLADSTARDHRVILTETKKKGALLQEQQFSLHVIITQNCLSWITADILLRWNTCVLFVFPCFLQVYLDILHPFSSDFFLHSLPSWWTLCYVGDSGPHLPDSCIDAHTHTHPHTHTHTASAGVR